MRSIVLLAFAVLVGALFAHPGKAHGADKGGTSGRCKENGPGSDGTCSQIRDNLVRQCSSDVGETKSKINADGAAYSSTASARTDNLSRSELDKGWAREMGDAGSRCGDRKKDLNEACECAKEQALKKQKEAEKKHASAKGPEKAKYAEEIMDWAQKRAKANDDQKRGNREIEESEKFANSTSQALIDDGGKYFANQNQFTSSDAPPPPGSANSATAGGSGQTLAMGEPLVGTRASPSPDGNSGYTWVSPPAAAKGGFVQPHVPGTGFSNYRPGFTLFSVKSTGSEKRDPSSYTPQQIQAEQNRQKVPNDIFPFK